MAARIDTEALDERLCIMLEAHPGVSLEAVREAAVALRIQEPGIAQRLARAEQDAGRDGRQVMRAVQYAASQI